MDSDSNIKNSANFSAPVKTEASDPPSAEGSRNIEDNRPDNEAQNRHLSETDSDLTDTHNRYYRLFNQAPAGYLIIDKNGCILGCNHSAARILGAESRFLQKKSFDIFTPQSETQKFFDSLELAQNSAAVQECEIALRRQDGITLTARLHIIKEEQREEAPLFLVQLTDVTEYHQLQNQLRKTIDQAEQKSKEVSALYECANSVLESKTFIEAAKTIFHSAKQLIGAEAGYVAILAENGIENDVLYLDPGPYQCAVDPNLPMPIRGLRSNAYEKRAPVYDNSFLTSEHMEYIPAGHVALNSVLFAPLVFDDTAYGLLGLGNKPGGFVPEDLRIAQAFSELAAVAMKKHKIQDDLYLSDRRYSIASEASNTSVWEMDIIKGEVVLDHTFWITNDLETAEARCSIDRWYDYIHPADRKVVREAIDQAFKSNSNSIDIQHHLSEVAGAKWVSLRGRIFRDENEKPERLVAAWTDINDLKLSEQEIAQHARELAASNKDLERFAYIASHDLQEPLRMISSYVKLLGERYSDKLDDSARDFIEFAVAGVRDMKVLIDDLLTYSRLGRNAPEPTEFDLAEVVDATATILRPLIEESGAVIEYGASAKIMAVRRQILQLLQNIISNAIKFRSEVAPIIKINTEEDEGSILITIADNGIGIAPQYHDDIFTIFRRLHSRANYDGTGIGLAVCKKIVDQHGGDIWVESKTGEGSNFIIRLPRKPGGRTNLISNS